MISNDQHQDPNPHASALAKLRWKGVSQDDRTAMMTEIATKVTPGSPKAKARALKAWQTKWQIANLSKDQILDKLAGRVFRDIMADRVLRKVLADTPLDSIDDGLIADAVKSLAPDQNPDKLADRVLVKLAAVKQREQRREKSTRVKKRLTGS